MARFHSRRPLRFLTLSLPCVRLAHRSQHTLNDLIRSGDIVRPLCSTPWFAPRPRRSGAPEFSAYSRQRDASGRQDVIGQARSGSGKTLAFLLPLVERALPDLHAMQALALVPTRELAVQVGPVLAPPARTRRREALSSRGPFSTGRRPARTASGRRHWLLLLRLRRAAESIVVLS